MNPRNNCETCGKLLEEGVTGNCFKCIREGDELFNIPEVKSPRLKWMDKHGVWKFKPKSPGQQWTATARGLEGRGDDEDSAIADLAKQMGELLWNEQ